MKVQACRLSSWPAMFLSHVIDARSAPNKSREPRLALYKLYTNHVRHLTKRACDTSSVDRFGYFDNEPSPKKRMMKPYERMQSR